MEEADTIALPTVIFQTGMHGAIELVLCESCLTSPRHSADMLLFL